MNINYSKLFAGCLVSCAISTATLLTSCSKDEQHTDTRVTHYATINLEGDEFMVLNVGEKYTEPGYSATEGTEDITARVVVSNPLDTNVGGFYDIIYSVSNKDNFSSQVSRTIMVVNHNSIASAYWGASSYISEVPITITDNGDGTYTIDDLMCGYYFAYRYPGYEPTYDFHLECIFKVNDDNTLTQVGSGSWYFSSKPTMAEGAYDPKTGVVTWTTSNGLSVKLTK